MAGGYSFAATVSQAPSDPRPCKGRWRCPPGHRTSEAWLARPAARAAASPTGLRLGAPKAH
eukprot:9444781-Lingulodinium_polyedra.AAC.1